MDGTPYAYLHRVGDCPVLHLPEVGWFFFHEDKIEVRPMEGVIIAPYLLGRAFALWLEIQSVHVLHGSCITSGAGAVGILGHSGAGKSTLSAALLARGHQLVTDDLIPLEFEDGEIAVYPGIPFSRLWPDTGRYFHPDFEAFDKVHPSVEKRKVTGSRGPSPRFFPKKCRLEALYLLERQLEDAPIERHRLTGAEALTYLVATSYRPDPVEGLGLQAMVLESLARLIEVIPVYRLSYPTGFERLEEVCDEMGLMSPLCS
ncbi:MAG: hypothetical protein QNK37_05985 [Acidobacteriota bacterium]|nr:hypothetical protein [Acidobacteriota bacterium]